METYSVEILNPKAIRLLEDLADLELIAIKPRPAVETQPVLSEAERAEAREQIRTGSPNLDLDAMLEHLRESREDRKMPFCDAE